MVARAEKDFGKIGILVNNAGNAGANPRQNSANRSPETSPEVWNSYIGVNLYGVMNCTAAVIPKMIERNAPGRLLTIISEAGRWGDAGLEIYAGAKAGGKVPYAVAHARWDVTQITANSIAIAMTVTPAIESHPQQRSEIEDAGEICCPPPGSS